MSQKKPAVSNFGEAVRPGVKAGFAGRAQPEVFDMPQYTLLIYVPSDGPPAEERELSRWIEYTDALRADGALVADNALEMTDTATTVRVRGGEPLITDGPFAETSEVLGGYYVIDVADLDAALEWAARIPSAPSGSVEVRPVMALPQADCAKTTGAGAQA